MRERVLFLFRQAGFPQSFRLSERQPGRSLATIP